MCFYSGKMCKVTVLCRHETITYMYICEYVFMNTRTNKNTYPYPKQKETFISRTYLVKDSG